MSQLALAAVRLIPVQEAGSKVQKVPPRPGWHLLRQGNGKHDLDCLRPAFLLWPDLYGCFQHRHCRGRARGQGQNPSCRAERGRAGPGARAQSGVIPLPPCRRYGEAWPAFANSSAFFVNPASIWTMGAFTSAGAVLIEPALNGGSGSYSPMSWTHSA